MSLNTWSDSSAICWCQNEPAEIALQNAVVRKDKTIQDTSEKTRPGIRMAVWVAVNLSDQRGGETDTHDIVSNVC